MSQFRNLVFEGGGVKGIAYAGAIDVLDARGDLDGIRRVAGTSAGAITAALLALGADGRDVQRIVAGTDFRSFMDSTWLVPDVLRTIRNYGWFRGKAFSEWLRGEIDSLCGDAEITFGELAERASRPPAEDGRRLRELFTVASDLTRGRAKVCSARHTPDLPVWLAVRMSMSIPLFFQAVRRQDGLLVDGGLTWNYPLDLFDHARYLDDPDDDSDTDSPARGGTVYNPQTLGFRVDTSEEIAVALGGKPPLSPVRGVVDYLGNLVNFMMEAANRAHLNKGDWHRTVFIEANGIQFTDFDLSDAQVRMLVSNGQRCTEKYFDWFDQPDARTRPVNKRRI